LHQITIIDPIVVSRLAASSLQHKGCELGDFRAFQASRSILADEAERGTRLSGPKL